MKKLILLVAVAAFATACNSKAGVNHGVLKQEHEPATAEEMHEKTHAAHEEHAKHETHTEEHAETKHEEVKDSTKVATEAPKEEKEHTEKAGH